MVHGDHNADEPSSRRAGSGSSGPAQEANTSPTPEPSEEESPDELVEAPAPGVPVSRDEFRRLKSAAAEHDDATESEEDNDGERGRPE